MATSWDGTGSLVTPGAGTSAGPDAATALPRTLLSLPRYARILGVNPAHFAGGVGETVWPMLNNRCNDVWARYSWQHADSVSHYDLANAIHEAEWDIARELGWWPAPKWLYQEVEMFPRHHRRGAYQKYGRNVRYQRKSVLTEFGKVIAPGQRATTLIEADVTVTYSDEDGDGFDETATVTVTTTLTDEVEICCFFDGTAADPGWEIRPARSKSISGGTWTGVYDAWLFLDPDVQAKAPTTDGFAAIDLDDASNYVSTVDVYRVYNDTTARSCQLLWEPDPRALNLAGSGFCTSTSDCVACELTTQDGCLHVRDAERGVVVPTPATYDDTDAQWEQEAFTEGREPDMVKLWYYAGHYSNEWLSGRCVDPLDGKWARAIAQMATARLERPFCSCGNAQALAQKWQKDAAEIDEELSIPFELMDNPFGTRYGEIMAWRQVKRSRRHLGGGAV